MSKTKLAIIVAAVVIVGGLVVLQLVGGSSPQRPGDPAVYSRIGSLTSCSALQSEFNAADARHGAAIRNGHNDQAEVETSYMQAADQRMRTIGCH